MTISTGKLAELLYPGIAQIFGVKYKEHEVLYKQIFDLKKSDKAFEKEQGITSLPTAAIKESGDEISFTDIFQGYQKEYIHDTYGLGVTITREMVEDDQYNIIKQIPAMAARSMIHQEEIVHTNVFNNGFNATYTGPDNSTFFATSHALVAGGTGQNRPTDATDLTQTGLENAIIDIMDFRDDQGKRLNIMPKTLFIPRSLYFTANKILQTKYATGSNNNDVNILSNMNLKLVCSNFLTDQDAWFLINDIGMGGLTSYTRRETEIDKFSDDRTENLNIKVTRRFATGIPADWRAAYGSPGA
jgi:phage major head subunit gpT-like protein